MSLTSILSNLLELNSSRQIITEAERKLIGTVVIIDNLFPLYIDSFDFPGGLIKGFFWDKDLKKDKEILVKPKLISCWLPDAGIYSSEDKQIFLLIKKIPKRQWLKSFNTITYIHEFIYNKDKKNLNNLMEIVDIIFRAKKKEIEITPDGNIWFFNKIIGKKDLLTGEMFCTNSLFLQELIDWRKNDFK